MIYSVVQWITAVYRTYRCTGTQNLHVYTEFTGVYRIYRCTQNLQVYTELTGVHRTYRYTQGRMVAWLGVYTCTGSRVA